MASNWNLPRGKLKPLALAWDEAKKAVMTAGTLRAEVGAPGMKGLRGRGRSLEARVTMTPLTTAVDTPTCTPSGMPSSLPSKNGSGATGHCTGVRTTQVLSFDWQRMSWWWWWWWWGWWEREKLGCFGLVVC